MLKEQHVSPPVAALVEEASEVVRHGDHGVVVIAPVSDPSKLLDGRARRLHGDVVDVLVDLVIAILDEEGSLEGSSH